MRKFIPALLLTATLPALAIAAPHGSGPAHGGPCGGPGDGPCARAEHGPKGPHGFGKHGGAHRGAGMHDLSPEQRDKMHKVMAEQAKVRKDIKQKYYDKLSEADKKAMADELQRSHEEARKQIRATLTPEQQKRFDEKQKWQDERSQEWKEFQQWKASKAGK